MRKLVSILALLVSFSGSAVAQTTTTTVLTVTSAGNAVTAVAAGSVVTLTATVEAGSTALTTGQVNFCDASAKSCLDIHLLGTAQLTSAGTAILKFRPGIGSHSYKAEFAGTKAYSASASSAAALSVTGCYPSSTGIQSTGGPGSYSLTATVVGADHYSPAPTGAVSFVDTSNSNAVLGTAALGSGSSALSFLNSANPTTGNNPQAIVVADFNGDGIPDFATLNYQSRTITASLGNGDGTFRAAASIPIGKFPNAFTVADFNGDGIPDLAVVYNNDYVGSAGSFVTVLLGNGDGTFTATAASPSVGNNPVAIVPGDFNGDGLQDLAVVNQIDSTVTILLGNGDGTFIAAQSSPSTGDNPGGIVAADFNGDGKLDLAILNFGSGALTVLLGNGDGTFTAAATPTTDVNPFSVSVADLNGDGIPDLVVGNAGGNLTVLLGVGDGTFTTVQGPAFMENLAIGDFNADGIPDLAGLNGSETVTFLGKGDGTFSTGPTFTPSPHNSELVFYSIAAADFNGDGVSDLVMAGEVVFGEGPNGQSQVLLSDPQSSSTASTSVTVGPGPHLVEASYAGDAIYTSTPSATITLAGQPVSTALNLALSAGPYTVGQSVTLNATLSPYSDAGYSANGETVSFNDGTSLLGTGTLSGGVATMNFVVPTAGQYSIAAVYGGDTIFIGSSSNSDTITVPATPSINWATPAAIPYGTALSAVQLDATSSIPGSFVYTPAAGTMLGSGAQTLSVTFTPSDTIDYTTATATVTLIVIPHLVVNTNADDAGTASNCAAGSTTSCSLRDALTAAKSYGGTITFDSTVFNATNAAAQNTITLGNAGTLAIPANTTITGATSGSGSTLSNLVVVSGNNAYGVFSVANGVTGAAISNLTITQGMGNVGGAINNSGSLTVYACTFSNNTVSQGMTGGAIENSGELTVKSSTFVNNSALNEGGAIYSTSILTVDESTFTGNSGGQGGAIYNGGSITMTNSTISGNTGSGAGIFNNGLAMGSNNVMSGDTGGECAGVGCFDNTYTNAAYFLVTGQEQEIDGVGDSGDITLGWSDNRGNQFSYTVHYGQFSTPAAIASNFGAGITNSDSPGSDAEGFGSLFVLVVDPADSGPYASFGPFTITNSSKSFTLTQVYQSLLFPSNGNIVGTVSKLSSLGNYGGPTQTMIPLPGSSAICAGVASGLAPGVTTDQRGFANTNTGYPGYSGNSPCVDAGSVQTDYALNFSSQPPASVTATTSLTAAVTLDESGSIFTTGTTAIPLTLTGNGVLLNGLASTSSGIATYPSLSVSLPGANDRLNANLSLNGTLSIAAASNSFAVAAAPTTTAGTSQSVIFRPSAQGVTLSAEISSNEGTVNAGTVTFTVMQGNTPIGIAVTSAIVSNGQASAVYTLPAGTAAGAYTIDAVYNAGGAFAASSDDTQTITVRQATPSIGWSTPAAVSYGTALGAAQLSATSSVAGTFAYSPAAGTVLSVGPQTITATFTPTDATDYTTATKTVTLTVNQATPTINWPTPTAILYGTALSAAQLNASSQVAGSFSYSPAAGTVIGAGPQTLTATFTPTDTTDYKTATATVTLTVNEALPTITWPTPAAITYGAGLGSGQLNAASSVAGSFAYSPTSGTVLGAGPQTLTATFTPTDTADYTTATTTVTLAVNKATPTVNWATPAAIISSTALSATQLDATASVPGTFVYSPAPGSTLPVGNDTLSATFTPTDNVDYATATTSVTLTVNPPPNPLPFLGSITPAISDAGGAPFTITVNGSGFLPSSAVYWGTTALATQFVSSTQLTATVTAADIAIPGATAISVQSPAPGGGTSDVLQFEVDSPSASGTAPTVPSTVVAVTAGSTATYSISFPSSVTNASASCLNLPAGAICSYSFATSALTISTSSTTPVGVYQVTVVFAETVASTSSALIILPFLLLPLFFLRKKLSSRRIWPAVWLSLVLVTACAFNVGCGGGSTPAKTTITQSVTSSGVVGITIH